MHINLLPCLNQIRNYCPWIKEERSRLERCWRRWKSPFEILSRMQLSHIPHFQSRIICQPSHTLETHKSYMPILAPWKPINTILHQNPSNLLPWSNPHKPCQPLSFCRNFLSSSKQAPFSLLSKNHLYPLIH